MPSFAPFFWGFPQTPDLAPLGVFYEATGHVKEHAEAPGRGKG